MEKNIEQGIVPTYADLQGDYSTLGKELSKGNLPGDVFHAYDELHEAIGNEMQRIADSKGQGAALSDARNYWRRMKQTFGQPLSEGDVATKALKTSAPDIASTEEQANRIRLLGSFDSRLPGLFEHIQNLQKGAESLPNPVPEQTRLRSLVEARKPMPTRPGQPEAIPSPEPIAPREVQPPARVEIPNRPEQVQPKLPKLPERVAPPERPAETPTKTIGLEDVRQAKLKSLTEEGVPGVRKVGRKIVNYGIGLHALWDAFSGRFQDLPRDIGLGAAGYGATEAFARLLERPDIQEMLTRPTAADLAQIPPELKGNLGPMLDAAKAKGIKVDPRLYAAAGVPQRKRVAAALQPQ
jgi:hypothetical protein